MKELIAITGASGHIGSEVIKTFSSLKIPFRPLVRDQNKVPGSTLFDYAKEETHEKALEGVDRLLLIGKHTEVRNFLKKATHLKQIVIISGVSANVRATSHLAEFEQCVYEAKIPYTSFRINWFMQNFTTMFRDEIVQHDTLSLPAGDSKTSFIDTRDIANAIAEVFNDKHLNKTYTLTGSEALTHTEVVDTIAHETRQKIAYKPLTDEEGRQKFLSMGWDPVGAEEVVRLFQEMRQGATAPLSSDLTRLIKRPPTLFSAFAKDYRQVWASGIHFAT